VWTPAPTPTHPPSLPHHQALGHACRGLHTARMDKGDWRVWSQCSGKHAMHVCPEHKALGAWCRGRSSGAVLAKSGRRAADGVELVLPA